MKNQPIRKDPDAGEDWRQEEKGMIEVEMVGWPMNYRVHGILQARILEWVVVPFSGGFSQRRD